MGFIMKHRNSPNLVIMIEDDAVEISGNASKLKRVFIPRDDPKLKRVFDVVFSVLILIMILPLLALISLIIMLTNGGAPIYAHERVGRGGRTFRCFKFRSMVSNGDEVLQNLLDDCPRAAAEWRAQRKLRNDPRILPKIGHFLRETSLDELPQFVNVLMGDMSVVGPRPVVRDELEKYGEHQSAYLAIRPGLTGPWQIGKRSNDSYENRVKLDVNYVYNRTMAVDISIIASTIRMVLRGSNPGAF